MDASEVVRRLGGTAPYDVVVGHATQSSLRRAVRDGQVLRLARGVYGMPELPVPAAAAAATHGVVSHVSAARVHGLRVPTAPSTVHVTVPPGARPPAAPQVTVHWSRLAPTDVRGGVTTVLRTVLDCAVTLPFGEAVAVADSALAEKILFKSDLIVAAYAQPPRRRGRCVRVAEAADGGADTMFESFTRALLVDAGVGGFVTQLPVLLSAFTVHVDLGDPHRRIAVEAEGFEYHSDKVAFARDCERYTELAAADWLVCRFTWAQVRFRPEWVVDVVRRTQRLRAPQRRRHLATPREPAGVS